MPNFNVLESGGYGSTGDPEIKGDYQYIRKYNLVVADSQFNGFDLSELRIKFEVKRNDESTPNNADIRVYNLEKKTAERIRDEFKKVTLQCGYEKNFGVIFDGNIKQVILGRESATDTFIDIIGGDGDLAYNYAVVKTSLAAGSTADAQIAAAIDPMKIKGVTAGHIGEMPKTKLPRGKVMFGNSRQYLRDVSQTTGNVWSIQDGRVTFVPVQSYLPGEAVVINAVSGMIGTPQQTTWGVNVKCLLNPLIQTGTRIKIDNASIERFKIDLGVKGNSPNNIPVDVSADGIYYVQSISHEGDTRGVPWYSNITCLRIDSSSNPRNAIPINYG